MLKLSRLMIVAFAALCVVWGCDDRKPTGGDGNKKIVVGFSQIGAESGWRKANTESIKAEAAKRGIDLRFADAQQKQQNQIEALQQFIVQRVDVIAFSPGVETGWEPVLKEVKAAGIPVILSDRAAKVGDDLYVTFIASDFIEEGRRAGDWLVKATSGKAVIVELEGSVGSSPAIDRKKGFAEVIATHPDMKIIKSQSGDFTRAGGKQVMESFLQSPAGGDITALYAHNDDMALGAIQAIEAAGKKPGTDILIVSVDAVRGAFEAMIDGKLNCTVECNPLLGPAIFDTVDAIVHKKSLPKRIVIEEGVFEQHDAAEKIKTRKY